MALAAEFYTRSLWEPGGEKPRAYLEQRGVDTEVAKRFGLGLRARELKALLGVMARQGIDRGRPGTGRAHPGVRTTRLLRPLPRPAPVPHP